MQFIQSGNKSPQSDEELIASFKISKDDFCISILFDRYSHLVFAVAMKYLKNEEDSKDVVLWLFEKLPHDLRAYQIKNFASWLHTVTKNECYRLLSKNRHHSPNIENIPEEPDIEEDEFTANYLPLLDKAISHLNKDQKTCIELFYLMNLSYQEICERTGFNLNQVKSHIQNGKRNLKILLLKQNNDR